jgi:mRNA-degrading endonuclease RelE of RelBE toxin-antitoxin system
MKMIKKSRVVFAEEKLQKDFNNLPEGELKSQIKKAIISLQSNAFCGIHIPKRLIPEIYLKKYQIENLWKYDLPDGWRIIYSIIPENKVEIISVILEWFNHKEYERRFHY